MLMKCWASHVVYCGRSSVLAAHQRFPHCSYVTRWALLQALLRTAVLFVYNT
jgi:hypothetical protein